MISHQKTVAICLLLLSTAMAPLIPFIALVIIPVMAVLLNAPILAIGFSVLIDAFLISDVTPPWVSLTLWTAISIPIVEYLRYNTTL